MKVFLDQNAALCPAVRITSLVDAADVLEVSYGALPLGITLPEA